MADALLERDRERAVLDAAVADAAAGRGRIVLVTGEAGMGKSRLVREWIDHVAADVRVLTGWCDDMATSRTLGPFHDVARGRDDELAAAVSGADTRGVVESVLRELDHPLHPTVLLLEDLHWADQATLDVVRYLGRRVDRLRAVLVLTCRQEALSRHHPLASVVGVLPSSAVGRLALPPLSPSAVATLLDGTGLDVADVMAVTNGNPFFVTELARAGGGLPSSITDAVAARLHALPPAARAAVDVLSVSPRPVPLDVALELVDAEALRVAEDRGLLVGADGRIGFGHELARRAARDTLTEVQRHQHHAGHLDQLLDRWGDALATLDRPFELGMAGHDARGTADRNGSDRAAWTPGTAPGALDVPVDLRDVRLAVLDHATALGRAPVVAAHAPGAAHDAFVAGAYVQALAHQAAALAVADLVDDRTIAALLLERAWSLYHRHRFVEAVSVARRSAESYARLGDDQERCRVLQTLSRLLWTDRKVREAGEVLARARPLADASEPHVRAEWWANHLVLLHATDRHDDVLSLAPAVRERARAVERPDLVAHVDNHWGGSQVLQGEVDAGIARVEQAREVADTAGWVEAAVRARVNLGVWQVAAHHWAGAERALADAIAFCDDHDLPTARATAQAQRAAMALDRGDWGAATTLLAEVEPTTNGAGVLEVVTAGLRALLAVRRGEPDGTRLVDRAWGLAEEMQAAQYLVPAACAAAELAWLEDRPRDADARLRRAHAAAGTSLVGDRLPLYDRLLGRAATDRGPHPDPDGPTDRGSKAGAMPDAREPRTWAGHGMPWEQALALVGRDRVEADLDALAILDGLHAVPAATWVRGRLRARGVTTIPRGPRSSTRTNPAGLTDRQVDVLELVVEGLTNRQIADRLVLSVRTVDHHVSAILQKLGVTSRQDAAAAWSVVRDAVPGAAAGT